MRYVRGSDNEEAALKNRPQMHHRFRHATLPVRTEVRAKHDDEDADDVDDDVDDDDGRLECWSAGLLGGWT